MTRDELIQLVSDIKYCRGTEDEILAMVKKLEENVNDPYVSDLIFYDEKSPEEIVDTALAYKPILL